MTVPVAFADVIQYGVTVNTSTQNGNYGYIDLQFNPSSLPTQTAFASVTNFSTDGTLDTFGSDPNDGTIGDVTGTLPGTLSFDNLTNLNDYTQGITFGNTISFDLDLSGPAIDTPDPTDFPGGSLFVLDFLNADESGFLFTADPLNDVAAGTVDLNPDGSTTATAFFSDANDDPSVVTFTGPISASVPEPSTTLPLGIGIIALAVFRFRR